MNKFIAPEKGEGESPTNTQTMEAASQAIALIADSSHELDLRRRNLFRPGLKQEFKSVCSDITADKRYQRNKQNYIQSEQTP